MAPTARTAATARMTRLLIGFPPKRPLSIELSFPKLQAYT
jgi:hypothetical protein